MWFDETFLYDPLGSNTEITIDAFLGLFLMTWIVKPLASILFAPLYYLWCDLAFYSQLVFIYLYGFTPEMQDNQEYIVTRSDIT